MNASFKTKRNSNEQIMETLRARIRNGEAGIQDQLLFIRRELIDLLKLLKSL